MHLDSSGLALMGSRKSRRAVEPSLETSPGLWILPCAEQKAHLERQLPVERFSPGDPLKIATAHSHARIERAPDTDPREKMLKLWLRLNTKLGMAKR